MLTWSVFSAGLYTLPTSVRHAAFQVASILTTTGYATADFEAWPWLCQVVLMLLIFIGGSAGSTAAASNACESCCCSSTGTAN